MVNWFSIIKNLTLLYIILIFVNLSSVILLIIAWSKFRISLTWSIILGSEFITTVELIS